MRGGYLMNQKQGETPNTAPVKQYLEQYRLYESLLKNGNRANMRVADPTDGRSIDVNAIKAKMLIIRGFILSLPDCREKMMLYYRYLHGRSVEQCAELLDVSRRTAFRIAEKALILAANHFSPR